MAGCLRFLDIIICLTPLFFSFMSSFRLLNYLFKNREVHSLLLEKGRQIQLVARGHSRQHNEAVKAAVASFSYSKCAFNCMNVVLPWKRLSSTCLNILTLETRALLFSWHHALSHTQLYCASAGSSGSQTSTLVSISFIFLSTSDCSSSCSRAVSFGSQSRHASPGGRPPSPKKRG